MIEAPILASPFDRFDHVSENRPSSPAAVVFDLDDTLLASERARLRTLRRLLGSPALVRRLARVNTESWRRYMAGEQTLEQHRIGRWAAVGIPEDEAAAVDVQYRAHYETIRIRLGARAMLAGLRSRGLRIGLLSNSTRDYVGARLAQVGLAACFDHVAEIQPGWHKPLGPIFDASAKALGTRPAETVMVGDLLEIDILPALEAGYGHAIWMTRLIAQVPPSVSLVRGPRDVLGVVDGLGVRRG